MTIEDFTTYIEDDSWGKLTVIADTITYNNLLASEDSEVYKDKGAGNIGDFEYKFKITCTDQTQDTCYFFIFGVSNNAVISRADGTTMGCVMSASVGGFGIHLFDRNTGNIDQYTRPSETGTWYFTFERTDTTAKLYIYSDEARTILLDTLQITCTGNSFRYLGAGYDGWGAATTGFSGTLEDLDLQEEVPPSVKIGAMSRKIGLPTPINIGLGV